MAYIYHYYGFTQIEPGSINHVDGTIQRDSMIISQDEYVEVKEAIAECFKISREKLTLASLTLLNPPSAAEAAKTVAMMM